MFLRLIKINQVANVILNLICTGLLLLFLIDSDLGYRGFEKKTLQNIEVFIYFLLVEEVASFYCKSLYQLDHFNRKLVFHIGNSLKTAEKL